MKGNLYTNQKCPFCGGAMVHDDRKHNCVCKPCNVEASKGYYVRFGRDICKRFKTYPEAAQFLSGLRFKESEGTLDIRDYKRDNPLSFRVQVARWLVIKEQEVSKETLRKYKRFAGYANKVWADRNIKTLSFGDIQDFLFSSRFTNSKYRADAASFLNHFFDWVVDSEEIKKPKIPKVKFELGWRTITDLETQQKIIDEVRWIAPEPKIAFGIELLSTYNALRPGDLRRIGEKDYKNGLIRIEHPTKLINKAKLVQLLPEHAEQWEALQGDAIPLPTLPYFRHESRSGVKPGSLYGKDLFYKWWVKACKNLGVEGLDLYGGTRHTTTTAIAQLVDEASAKKSSGHVTNKAFERYCQAVDATALKMAKIIKASKDKGDQQVINIKTATKKSK